MEVMANIIQKILSALAWFFGVIFIFIGILMYTENNAFFANALIVIGGVLLLPPIKRLALDASSKFTKGRLTVLAVILILSGIIRSPTAEVDQTKGIDDSEKKVETEEDKGSDTEITEEVVPEETSSEDMIFNDEDTEEFVEDAAYEYEDTQFTENTRSKFPSFSLEFSVLVQQSLLGGPLNLSIVSRNKEPVLVYDIIVNDGVNCPIYGGKEVKSGVMYYGEKYQFPIVNCDLDQIIEVKIITEKGYVIGNMEIL